MQKAQPQHRPLQDRFVATLWLCEAIDRAKALKQGCTTAYLIFTTRMIANKFRIQEWHLEYIGEKFKAKQAWARMKYEKLYPQHK